MSSDTSTVPRARVSQAFAAQIETGLDFEVHRNRGEPADLDARDEYVILLDGPEEPEQIDEQTGLALHTMRVALSCYVKGNEVADDMNVLLAKLRSAAVADRTLGGLLWGETEPNEADSYAYFTGMKLGGLTEWDPFSTVGSSPAGYFCQELELVYATPPNEPMTLVGMGEI